MRAESPSAWATVFSSFLSISHNSRKNNGQAFSFIFLLRGYHITAVITSMRQARTSGWVRAPDRTPSAPNSECRMFMLRIKTLSAAPQREIATDEIHETKNYRECSNRKALMSVHWRAQCHTKLNGRAAAGTFRTSGGVFQNNRCRQIHCDSP